MISTIPIDHERRVQVVPVLDYVNLSVKTPGREASAVCLELNQARVLMHSLAWAVEAIETQRVREAAGPRASDHQQAGQE